LSELVTSEVLVSKPVVIMFEVGDRALRASKPPGVFRLVLGSDVLEVLTHDTDRLGTKVERWVACSGAPVSVARALTLCIQTLLKPDAVSETECCLVVDLGNIKPDAR
jgi:hypothetical protein